MEQILIDFIKKNEQSDISSLLLGKNRYPDIDVSLAAKCIQGRRVIKEKVPLWYDHPGIIYSDSLPLEQCSSQITAIHKQNYIPEGGFVADLTGGFGIDSYFISQKCSTLHYYERNRELTEIAIKNFSELGAGNITVKNSEVTPDILKEIPDNYYHLIYIDPARRGKKGERLFSMKDCEPDMTLLQDQLLRISPKILVKLSPMADITTVFNELRHCKHLDIISVNNECKELLLLIERGFEGITSIDAIDLYNNTTLSFNREREHNAKVTFTAPEEIRGYIYEPNSSILKGGAFKYTSEKFGIKKISKDTHFYIHPDKIENFPGRIGEVLDVIDFSKKSLQKVEKEYPSCSVVARNFPIKTEELKKRVKCTESKEIKGLFTTLNDKSKVIIIYKRLFE